MGQREVMKLLRETLFSPGKAAEKLLATDFRSDALWMVLVLMGVMNALVHGLSMYFSPIPEGAVVPTLFLSPLLFGLASVLSLLAMVYLLFWLGQMLQGRAALKDILVLVAWVQVLRLLAQIVGTVAVYFIPALGGLAMLVATVWGIVILVVFINKAHQFTNPFKGLGVLIGAMLGMVIGLSILFGALGASTAGVA